MNKCIRCGCFCDPSDTINGVCDDCREEEYNKETEQDKISIMLNAKVEQMELEL